MEDKRYLHNSRKIRNVQKMIKNLQNINGSCQINLKKIEQTSNIQAEQFESNNYLFGFQRQQNEQNLFQSQQQKMEYKVFTQTVENLQSLIKSNQQKVQGLQKKNQFLLSHLQNMNNLFNKVQSQRIFCVNNSDGSQENSNKNLQFNQQLLSQNNYYQNQINNTYQVSKKSQKSNLHKKVLENSQKQDFNQNQPVKKSRVSSNNHPHFAWHEQNQRVKNFLNNWLKKNVEQQDSSSTKMIEKRIVLLLYLKWKELQNFQNKNNLTNTQILQMITNEMKSTFNCTCTTKGYEGLSFVKKAQGQKTDKLDTIQSQKNQQSQNKLQVNNQQQQKPEDRQEEQFSFDIQCEEDKDESQNF